MSEARRLNLTAALTVAAAADLLLHRLLDRLFLPQHPTGLASLASDAGRFAFHLGGVLGLLVLVGALALLLRRGDLFPRPMRYAVGCIAVFFVAVAAVGILLLQLPDRYLIHLKTSHAFLAWFIVLALWRSPGPRRGKLGVTLFAVPAILQAFALFTDRMGWAPPLPAEIARAAEICALLAGALAPLLLGPEPTTRRRGLLGAAAGVLTLAVLLATLIARFDLVQALTLYGFRLDLPPLAGPGAVTYVALVIAAFVGLAMSVVWTLSDRSTRLVGYGLLLTAAAGYQALSPSHVVFAACGLLAMATAVGRPGAPAPSRSPSSIFGAEAAGL
jgi:hypothetical protein